MRTTFTRRSHKKMIITTNRIQQKQNVHQNPKTLNEPHCTKENCTTGRGGFFLLHDSALNDETSESRLVLFGTRKNLDVLQKCDLIAVDGTFEIAPQLFYELFTIHGEFLHAQECDIGILFFVLVHSINSNGLL